MKGYSWRYVQLAMSALSVVIVGQFLFVDEPLRWLLANQKHEEGTRLVRKAGKKNGIKSDTIASAIARYFSQDGNMSKINHTDKELKAEEKSTNTEPSVSVENTSTAQTKVTALALVKHLKLRRVTLVMLLAWFTNSLTYYGLYMVSSVMSGNRYLNLFLSSVAEVPASLLVFPIILKCGRRPVLIALHLLAGLSLITAAILNATTGGYTGYIALTCVIVVGKVGISGTYSVIFMYTPEVYPTNIRAFGLGAASVSSRIGGILAPFAATVARELPWAPVAVFGGLCLLVALACPLLPETKGRDLPQTLVDLEKLFLPEKNLKHNPNVVLRNITAMKY
ncbi:solute carrier family 22 member 3-like [Liolophura sinensis]|uniref:solute carrier family 22 member 3-like n=1 Tax=Liolophura sinensis TaxID=3198878 RepID=UPI00315895D4